MRKKIVAANRQNKGSDWVALAQEYGQGYTVRFISTRPTFAAIEEASQAFMHNPVGVMVGDEPYVRSPQRFAGDRMVGVDDIAALVPDARSSNAPSLASLAPNGPWGS